MIKTLKETVDSLREYLFQTQQGQCLICAEEIDIHTAHIDHVIPLRITKNAISSDYASADFYMREANMLSNLGLVHEKCNMAKNDRSFWQVVFANKVAWASKILLLRKEKELTPGTEEFHLRKSIASFKSFSGNKRLAASVEFATQKKSGQCFTLKGRLPKAANK
jgi:hypothetical protein